MSLRVSRPNASAPGREFVSMLFSPVQTRRSAPPRSPGRVIELFARVTPQAGNKKPPRPLGFEGYRRVIKPAVTALAFTLSVDAMPRM